MELRSVTFILTEARRTARRFPLAALACAATCATAWTAIAGHESYLLQSAGIALGFAAVLFFGLGLANERFPLPAPARPAHLLLAGGLFSAYFFYLVASHEHVDYSDRIAQAGAFALLLASCAPFLAAGGSNGLWQFVRRLLTRAVVSWIYTVVLFAGTALALAAVEKLLGAKIPDKTYAYLWTFAAMVFWPLHLMGGAPEDAAALEEDTSYPRGLKLFTQYALIPLAAVYFLILYVYLGKILVTQQWPQGWVSWLTTSASALGLATFLLLYPARDEEGNGWIRAWSKGFCFAALPLLLVLFAALYKRAAQYGITEHRYFLIVFGLWLAGMFLYFLVDKTPKLKAVPLSLAALAAATAFGPWGAYSVSLRSQTGRLERLLAANGLLKDGKAVKGAAAASEVRQDISGTLDYLVRRHGTEPLKKYFGDTIAEGGACLRGGCNVSQDLMTFMGQEYLGRWAQAGDTHFSIQPDAAGIDVRGYALAVRFHSYGSTAAPDYPGDGAYRALLRQKENKLLVFRGKAFFAEIKLDGLLRLLAEPAGSEKDIPQARLCADSGDGRVRACLSNVSGTRGAKGAEIASLAGTLLLKTGK